MPNLEKVRWGKVWQVGRLSMPHHPTPLTGVGGVAGRQALAFRVGQRLRRTAQFRGGACARHGVLTLGVSNG